MSRYLCISVTLLDPLFHGKGDSDAAHPDGRPEWPPSPMRLFQAMVAAARNGCRALNWSSAHTEAFCWLERLDPPRIVVPDAWPAASYTLFVPNNDSDKIPDRQDRLTSKVVRPTRLTASDDGGFPRIHYVWPIRDVDWPTANRHVDVLCREARYLVALGWGIDQAVAEGRILTDPDAAGLVGKTWRAWRTHRSGAPTWRVPVEGSLKDLEETYYWWARRIEQREYRPSKKTSRFDTVYYMPEAVLPPRAYAVFELPDGRAFRPEDVAQVATMLRSITYRCAVDDTHVFPGGSETYVAGHVGEQKQSPPRFSYIPLPTIGFEHADGMVRRVLIAEPLDGDGSHARWAQWRLTNAVLRDEDGRDRGVLLELWRTSSRGMVARFVGEARTWCTVTPVVLPGFDDAKQLKAERLFLAAATQAGIPTSAIDRFTLRKAPFWPSARSPRSYALPSYLTRLPVWHVGLQFREPVHGPVALGAGRHVGLGLFAHC